MIIVLLLKPYKAVLRLFSAVNIGHSQPWGSNTHPSLRNFTGAADGCFFILDTILMGKCEEDIQALLVEEPSFPTGQCTQTKTTYSKSGHPTQG